jgi:N6-adenosine-specific RNA methylase IME4
MMVTEQDRRREWEMNRLTELCSPTTHRSVPYPTMTLEEICALPVKDLAADDAMLHLWVTAPMLCKGVEIVKAWGFEYRTCMVWDKEVIGLGYYLRIQHETLLVCRWGDIPTPLAGTQPSSVYRERRSEHSAKPIFFYKMIETAYPQLPKIELFSRSPREGWSAWGNQAGATVAEAVA